MSEMCGHAERAEDVLQKSKTPQGFVGQSLGRLVAGGGKKVKLQSPGPSWYEQLEFWSPAFPGGPQYLSCQLFRRGLICLLPLFRSYILEHRYLL